MLQRMKRVINLNGRLRMPPNAYYGAIRSGFIRIEFDFIIGFIVHVLSKLISAKMQNYEINL